MLVMLNYAGEAGKAGEAGNVQRRLTIVSCLMDSGDLEARERY